MSDKRDDKPLSEKELEKVAGGRRTPAGSSSASSVATSSSSGSYSSRTGSSTSGSSRG